MVELIAAFFLFLIVLFTVLDLALLLQGVVINEALAKNAARSAAMGPPGKLEKGVKRLVLENQSPYKRAYAAVQVERNRLGQVFEIVDPFLVKETIEPPVPSELFGGPVNGTVSVESTIAVHPKFIFSLFFRDYPITVTARKSFPYTWVMKAQMTSGTQLSNTTDNKH
jgi:hypothetical protein